MGESVRKVLGNERQTNQKQRPRATLSPAGCRNEVDPLVEWIGIGGRVVWTEWSVSPECASESEDEDR